MEIFSLVFLLLIVLFITHIFVKNNVDKRMNKILKDIDNEDIKNKEQNNLE